MIFNAHRMSAHGQAGKPVETLFGIEAASETEAIAIVRQSWPVAAFTLDEIEEDPHEVSELHVVGPGPNGYAVTDDRGTCVADGLNLDEARGYLPEGEES